MSGPVISEAQLPDGYTLLSHAYGPIRVPERAPLVIIANAVAFPDTWTVLNVSKAAAGRAIRALGEERYPAMCLVTAQTKAGSVSRQMLARVERSLKRLTTRDRKPGEEIDEVKSYLGMWRFMEARVVCKRLLEEQPKSPELLTLLAHIYAEEGNRKKALAVTREANAAARLAGVDPGAALHAEPSDSSPYAHTRLPDVGCVARVRALRQEGEQRFRALLEVGPRVQVDGVEPRPDFPLAFLEAMPDGGAAPSASAQDMALLKDKALATARADLQSATLALDLVSAVTSPLTLAGLCAAGLGLPVKGQQELLEASAPERIERVLRILRPD